MGKAQNCQIAPENLSPTKSVQAKAFLWACPLTSKRLAYSSGVWWLLHTSGLISEGGWALLLLHLRHPVSVTQKTSRDFPSNLSHPG